MHLKPLFVALLAVSTFVSGTPSPASETRIIELNGVLNTRDLGGLQTEDGRSLRTGQIIRSGEIDAIDEAGKATLDTMGVSTVVDLRTTREATEHPAEWPEGQGPARYNFPLMEQEAQEIEDMRIAIKSGTAKAEDTEALFYEAFATVPQNYAPDIRNLFDVLLAQPEGEAVLVHCSGGKDRTGIATALVLSALGVTREDIEADFLMSNVQKKADTKAVEIANQVNKANGTNMTPEAVWPSLGIRPDHLGTFYDNIATNYGSVEGYLHDALGLTAADIQTLRDRYLE